MTPAPHLISLGPSCFLLCFGIGHRRLVQRPPYNVRRVVRTPVFVESLKSHPDQDPLSPRFLLPYITTNGNAKLWKPQLLISQAGAARAILLPPQVALDSWLAIDCSSKEPKKASCSCIPSGEILPSMSFCRLCCSPQIKAGARIHEALRFAADGIRLRWISGAPAHRANGSCVLRQW